jgi:subtilisin family serine protease
MKKTILLSAIMLMAISLALTGCGSMVETNEPATISASSAVMSADAGGSARKIVVFEKGVSESEQSIILRGHGAVMIKPLKLINAQVVVLPEQAKAPLLKETGVQRIDDDVIVSALPAVDNSGKPGNQGKPGGGGPTQPAQQLPWGIDRIDAELVWTQGLIGTGIKIAIIDTGIDLSHPDLKVAGGTNTIVPAKSYADDNGHGTHCAGIIAALNNNIGVVGVAPGASIYAVKALARNGKGYISDIIEGIQWSVNNGMQVISMSLGATSTVQSLHDAVAAAYAANLTLVAAAGNDSGRSVEYPAAYPEVIAVSATDSTNTIASFSSVGPQVELAAPGVGILSTYPGGKYATMSGTSMACPHVAATVALIIAAGRASTPDAIRSILAATADDLGAAGRDSQYGFGLVDAEQAATGVQTHL